MAAWRETLSGQHREAPPSLPMDMVFERMRAIGAAATSAADLQRAMGAFGMESDSILGPAAAEQPARNGRRQVPVMNGRTGR